MNPNFLFLSKDLSPELHSYKCQLLVEHLFLVNNRHLLFNKFKMELLTFKWSLLKLFQLSKCNFILPTTQAEIIVIYLALFYPQTLHLIHQQNCWLSFQYISELSHFSLL